jgi:hypothetical protein
MMAWKTNLYDAPKNKGRLYILDTIIEYTQFSSKGSGVNYVFSGNPIDLGENLDDFMNNNDIRLLLNGVELDKNTDITWIDKNSFSLSIGVDKDDIIIIYG